MKKLISLAIIVLLLLLIRNIVFSIKNLSENTKIVTSLTQELAEKKHEHELLQQKLAFVNSNEYVEEQARKKLHLVKKEEHIVLAPDEAPKEIRSLTIKKEIPNWKKWIDLFF